MSDSSQKQKAGDNSSQIQAGTMIVNMGIDEKRVREICDETFQIARRDMTAEAYEIATQRVSQFEDTFVPKIQKVEGALDALKDPAFQFALTRAHKTAASTDRFSDYEVLSELLVHRIERKDDRIKATGINRAIEIVDQVSGDALIAITVAFAIEKFLPISNSVINGLNALDALFEKLCYEPLPKETLWMEHLDILDAIRVNPSATLKKLETYYSEQMADYCTTGIKIESNNYKECMTILSENDLPPSFLSPHELDSQYVRLPVLKEDKLDLLCMDYATVDDKGQVQFYKQKLSQEQRNALHKIYALYANDQTTVDHFKGLFCTELSKHPNLARVKDWWNSIPHAFNITTVGTALAYANAKRRAPEIPAID